MCSFHIYLNDCVFLSLLNNRGNNRYHEYGSVIFILIFIEIEKKNVFFFPFQADKNTIYCMYSSFE